MGEIFLRVRPVAVGWVRCVLLAAALAAGGCGERQSATTELTHAWINSPTTVDDKAVVLSPWLVYPVHAEARAEAIAELEHEPYIQISPSMAAHYTRADVRVPAEMRPFLIRGLDTGGSQIQVIQSMHGLWVKVIGGEGETVTAQPLVVLIDPTPVHIYVTLEANP